MDKCNVNVITILYFMLIQTRLTETFISVSTLGIHP